MSIGHSSRAKVKTTLLLLESIVNSLLNVFYFSSLRVGWWL